MDEKSNYAEITLDGAGYCYFEGNYSGLFTRWVESCIVCVVRFNDRFLLIHDTGQLDIKSLTDLAMKGGKALSIGIIYGNLSEKIDHEKRVLKFANSIHLSEKDIVNIPSNMNKFNVIIDVDGAVDFLNPNDYPQSLVERNDNQVINDIIKFNNFFIEPNSQSIIVDLQFDGENYLKNTAPVHTIAHVIEKIKEQPKFFDLNMLVLYPVIKHGLLDSPKWFSDFLYKHVYETNILSNNLTEAQRYREFIDLDRN